MNPSFQGDETACNPLIGPGYTKSVHHVLRDATRFAIAELGGLDILMDVSHHSDVGPESDTGSWVVRVDRLYTREEDPPPFATFFAASDQDEIKAADILGDKVTDKDVLTLRGISMDRVVEISEVLGFELWREDRLLEGAIRVAEEIARPENLRQPANTFYSTLVARATVTEQPVIDEGVQTLAAVMDVVRPFEAVPLEQSRWLWSSCRNRHFFVTDLGRSGLGPRAMACGDIVTILSGA